MKVPTKSEFQTRIFVIPHHHFDALVDGESRIHQRIAQLLHHSAESFTSVLHPYRNSFLLE